MIIQSTIRAARANPPAAEELGGIALGDHDIVWDEDSDRDVALEGDPVGTGLTGSSGFRTFALEKLFESEQPENARKIKAAYLSLGMNAVTLAGEYFPEVTRQPIQGMEFIVSSAAAFDAWTDKDRSSNVGATLATGKAVLEAIDVLAPYFPALSQVQPYTKVAGVALKTAESVYLVYTAHQET